MIKTTSRAALGALLLLSAVGASANPFTTKTIEVNGVFQEQIGQSSRCPSQIGGTIAGYGDSAIAGRVAFIATDCIAPSGPLFNFSQGRFIIVTTSGDQIFANYSGELVPTGDGAKYVFSGATFQVTGGNGRYAKASGGGTLSGGEDLSTGAGTIKLSGQVASESIR
ncbi:MAG TPA: hypothetical protein VFS02_05785 [Telluria sp.]|nr:hypothetical protein [Telluria sp.]